MNDGNAPDIKLPTVLIKHLLTFNSGATIVKDKTN